MTADSPFSKCTPQLTSRKTAEEEIRRLNAALEKMAHLKETLHRAQSIAKMGSWRLDIATSALQWSAETYRIFAIPLHDHVSQADFLVRTHPDDREMVMSAWHKTLTIGEPYDFEHRIVVNGQTLWVREVARIERDAENRPLYGVGTVQDITERKQYGRDLEAARKAADAANQAKSEFLSTMSHEIRTPINSIMGMAQLMEETTLTGEQREYLDAIRTSSYDLLSLLNAILDLAKIESGKIELEQRDFSLRGSIREIIKSQIAVIHGKGLTIETDIPAVVPDNLTGDQLRLKQILLNLVSNAIKFTHQGGIVITCTVCERHADLVRLQIGVSDSGIGITPEAVAKIFSPFVQANAATTRKSGGTGLGLSICSRLAELMGGDIRAESTEGAGSTFFLQLPFAVKEPVAPPHDRRRGARAPAVWSGPSLRILHVDDQEANLFFCTRLLQKAGHWVMEARNGRDALQKWEQGAFDLILMDAQMPLMSGIEATQAIREMERQSGDHIPIIAVTARALHEEREVIMSQGFDGFLAKPIIIEQLFDILYRCLGKNVPHKGQRDTPPQPEVAEDATRDLQLLVSPLVAMNFSAYPDRLRMYLELLLNDLGAGVVAMEAACGAGDAGALGKATHAARGLVRALRDPEPEQIVERIEMASQTGSFRNALENLSLLGTIHATLRHTVAAHPVDR